MVSQISFFSGGKPVNGELDPICVSQNLEELGYVVGIHGDGTPINHGVGVVSVVLPKNIVVEDLNLIVLNGTLEIEVRPPSSCLHELIYLHGLEHLYVHIVLNGELVLGENLLKCLPSLLVTEWRQIILLMPFGSLVELRTFSHRVFPFVYCWGVSLSSTSL